MMYAKVPSPLLFLCSNIDSADWGLSAVFCRRLMAKFALAVAKVLSIVAFPSIPPHT